MKAEILSIGTELLLGQIADTNAQWLAQQLPPLGIDLYRISQIGDNLGRLTELLQNAIDRSDLVITTGGLGPTEDDVTREAIAALVGEEPRVDPELEKRLRGWFAGRNIQMPERNIKQAWVLPSTQAMDNPRGTAPGWFTEFQGKVIASMPGVPNEMHLMWEEQVVPRLRPRLGGLVIASRTIKTFGIGEASVEEMVQEFIRSNNPTVGTYAKSDGVHLRLTAKAASKDEAEAMLSDLEAKIQPILGSAIWGADDDTMEGVIARLLVEQEKSIASMESCTSGLVANALADPPGSSAYFRGGLVTYTEAAKIRYGVQGRVIRDHGVVSPETAAAMAEAARFAMDADIGVSTTGVAGPSEVDGIPPGTVFIGVATEDRTDTMKMFWPRQRSEVKRWATLQALNLLRKRLLNPDRDDVASAP